MTRVIIYETTRECLEVDIDDALDPESDAFEKAVEGARVNADSADRQFIEVSSVSWELHHTPPVNL